MIDDPTDNTDTNAATDPDDDESKPSSEFLQALTEFERGSAGESIKLDPVAGMKVRGRIVSIGDELSFVDFGGRSEGVVDTRHLRNDEGALQFEVDDELDLFVTQAQDQVTLAPSLRADPAVAMAQVREAYSARLPVQGKVVTLNAGGLEVDVAGVRGFCPFSQVETSYCADPSAYVGKTLSFLVTEMKEERGNAVLSRRALLKQEEEAAAERLLATLRPGSEVDGTVARLEPFGAFVNLGGVDGLVHVSEIRHERTEHPGEVLAVGQKVRVRVQKLDTGKDGRPRISLSMKAAAPDPWLDIEERFWQGRRVRGLVQRLTDFGAFVNLAPGIDGLVHVSEAAATPVAHVKDCLAPNQEVEAVVRSVDKERKRISLSIKEALATSGEAARVGGAVERQPTAGDAVDGYVAGIKTYGLFVDLPVYGHRARALVPHEETGEKRGTDLNRRFSIGDKIKVEVVEVGADGKIKCSMTRLANREQGEEFQAYRKEAQSGRAPDTGMAAAFRRAIEGRR